METNETSTDPQKHYPERSSAKLVGVAVVVLLVVGGLLFYYGKSRDKTSATKVRDIRIAQAGDFFLYAPLYIAADAGLFEKQGLRVAITTTGGDEKTWAAVISGDVSFGIADPTFVAVSDIRGQPGKVIASIVNGVPFWGVTMKPEIPAISSGKGLEPYRVASFPAPSTAFTLQRKMFVDAGLKPNIREGAFGTLLAMLQSGQADIALELEPNVSQAVANGAKVVYSLGDVYGDFAITGLTAKPELLAADPELARQVVSALQMAVDFARTKPDETLDLLAKRFPEIKREIAKEALNRVLAARIIPEDVTISARAWDKAMSLRKEAGDVPNPKGMKDYVDNSFAEWAKNHSRLK